MVALAPGASCFTFLNALSWSGGCVRSDVVGSVMYSCTASEPREGTGVLQREGNLDREVLVCGHEVGDCEIRVFKRRVRQAMSAPMSDLIANERPDPTYPNANKGWILMLW